LLSSVAAPEMTPRPPLVCCRRGITAAHEKSKIKSACYRSANGRAAAFPSEIKVSSRTNQAWLKAFGGGKAHPSGPRRMERAMQIDSVRRLCNGVIDIDSYRREALILRRQTGVKFFRSIGRSNWPFVGEMVIIVAFALALHLMLPMSAGAEVPEAIAARGEAMVTTVHAVGAQVYECKLDSAGKLAWQFREPIATLFVGGETVGRHYAGPNWEMNDGSAVRGKVVGQAPGERSSDISLLKLEAAPWGRAGQFSSITTIQRLNTRGGVASTTSCDSAGTFLSVPYTADYAFYRKAGPL
jgi:hypothetical protein